MDKLDFFRFAAISLKIKSTLSKNAEGVAIISQSLMEQDF
jgi:hypothetical protein